MTDFIIIAKLVLIPALVILAWRNGGRTAALCAGLIGALAIS